MSLLSRLGFKKSRLTTVRTCPICGWSGNSFSPGGGENKIRFDCRCPNCVSFERHRLAYMVANQLVELDYSNVLHVAPEKPIESFLRSKSEDYLSIDLFNPAMAKMDITNLKLESNSKTLVWISHVLEHVKQDTLAIKEISRVLKPEGIALVQVPIWREKTFTDPNVKTKEDRQRTYFQSDHVRLYGLDILDLFTHSGFKNKIYTPHIFGPELVLKHQLSFVSTNEVFIIKKL